MAKEGIVQMIAALELRLLSKVRVLRVLIIVPERLLGTGEWRLELGREIVNEDRENWQLLVELLLRRKLSNLIRKVGQRLLAESVV